MERDLKWREDIEIAEQLHYPLIAIRLLKEESNPAARQRILHDARKGVYNRR